MNVQKYFQVIKHNYDFCNLRGSKKGREKYKSLIEGLHSVSHEELEDPKDYTGKFGFCGKMLV